MEMRPPLVPILVSAAGRSGTTALMQLLASSPAVVAEREYPYESRYLTYLFSWSRMLCGDQKTAGKWQRGSMMPGPPEEIGGLPWRELIADPNDFANTCFSSAWEQFTASAPDAGSHYIEKVPQWIAAGVPGQLPSKVIHLVRDPRDVWLSVSSFNKKRGFLAFGRKKDQQEEDFLDEFLQSQRERLEPLCGQQDSEHQLLVRYEDMISDSKSVADRLGSWLGLQLDPAALSQRDEQHVTSGKDPKASLGRWKRELPRDLSKRFRNELGALLSGLGYE